MIRQFSFFMLLILLSACSAPAPAATPALTATFTPLPPSSNPTETPTLTPTLAVFSDTLGLTSDFAAKVNGEGINSTISGEQANWIISQVISSWNADGIALYEQNVNVVSLSSDAKAIHNASYPDGILTGIDSQGKTVFWSEEEKAWFRPLEKSNDIVKPISYPPGKQYLVIESALLNPNLNKPFPQESADNFQGWSIDFEYDPATDSSHAYLRPRNNQSIRWVLDENGKPIWLTTKAPNGTVYESVLVQLLNPADPAHPKTDETMFVLASAGEWWISSTKIGGYRDLFKSGVTPLKRGGAVKRLAKSGVHWQTHGTSTSTRAANEPTRYILPAYGLPRKGSNWKREYSCS